MELSRSHSTFLVNNGTLSSVYAANRVLFMVRDAPNAWPPHQYIILQALNALPLNVTSGSLPTPNSGQSTYSLIPSGQIGVQESDLLGQPIYIAGKSHNASSTGSAADINTLNGTVINGGNATTGEGWASTLQRELANRYFTSAFCSWCVTLYPKRELYLTSVFKVFDGWVDTWGSSTTFSCSFERYSEYQ